MKRFLSKENFYISSTIGGFFLIFLYSWFTNAGAWVYGLYAEVDGQLFAWLGRFLIQWGSPLDMNTINPFEGMISVFIPVNAWWNPGALVLGLPASKLANFILSYSIYWLEIFFSIYFLARTIGLKKIESVIAAEIFVFLLFPPFSAYFTAPPTMSAVPLYAHLLACLCIMTMAYIKLGREKTIINLFYFFLFALMVFIIMMSGGFGFLPSAPIYALLFLGAMLQNANRQQFIWKISSIGILVSAFFVLHSPQYYQGLLGYMSSSTSDAKAISFAMPTALHKHTSIFFNSSAVFSIFHFFAFLGGIIGLFYRDKKYKWIAMSFIFIVLLPEVTGFLIENRIISGTFVNIGINYYVWNAYPLYCIFFVLFISFLLHCAIKMTNKINVPSEVKIMTSQDHSLVIKELILLFPLAIMPILALYFTSSSLLKHHTSLKQPKETPIVVYLEKNISLKPNEPFRGSVAEYLASSHSPLREINYQTELNSKDSFFTADYYIMAREFLNRSTQNRHMLTDLWNYNIPTLEEYAHLISKPMYIFFNKMLANKDDIAHGLFLNVYKLDINVLRAMGVRYVISDKILNEKHLHLVLTEKQLEAKNNSDVNFDLSISAKQVFEDLKNKYKNKTITSIAFKNQFKKIFEKTHPNATKDKGMIYSFLDMTFSSHGNTLLSSNDISGTYDLFRIMLFSSAASPPLYLYEISNPNLGTFSPIHVIKINDGNKLFTQLSNINFSFEDSVIVQDSLPTNIVNRLVRAKKSRMRFEPNAVRIQAESNGVSMLLLPVQYSHCYRITEITPPSPHDEPPHLIRANLIHSALLFEGKIDVKLNFSFGINRNIDCRANDLLDLKNMGLLDTNYLTGLHKRAVSNAQRA